MPPAKKRPRRYDSGRTRAAVLAQYGKVREAAAGLGAERLALPTRLGEWTVRDLLAHIGIVLDAVTRALDRPEPSGKAGALVDWPSAVGGRAPHIADRAHDLAARHPDPVALLAESERNYTAALARHPGPRLLDTGAGPFALDDYLVTRALELVVHTDDLNAAVPGLGVPLDRQALAAATRLLADTLAANAPGGATEVRIPPYAVVQCVEGPRHTRGTPPNVVETDPLTWIRLATGRLTWREALEGAGGARVLASGERADIGALLPLMS